ncbi:MAG: hypothetical protein IPJ79_09285 [Bacteroidetes bacterium]|nr:hypothetical protein [Bacteroidota bacterium]
MICAAALSRLLPHPYNFTPIGAMALFGGTYIANKKLAFVIPLLAMFISDVLLQLTTGYGFHWGMPFVYGSFMLITCLGFYLRKLVQRQTIMVCSLVGSLLFFFVTNFGTWATPPFLYPHTAAGLVDCYIKAIPFFGSTIMGDLFYNLILFGAYSIIKWRFPVLAKG